ncbi:glycosyltransferase family 32 protein [uncultured Sphingomonas sp.]|uniref:glycosyltransferase family 32 protein n=1 Tax=uncultured Sphingomonas sp. TaxID=158754 RepID=UPI0035CA2790
MIETRFPRTVVQTYPSNILPPALAENRQRMVEANPAWTFLLYDDAAIIGYIRDRFDQDVLKAYLSIDPSYGAARADLFRYLRIFAEGGVYLDVKSTLMRPLDTIITPQEEYLLCQWANGDDEPRRGFGLHKELRSIPGGEFQQWHIMARAGHPFLEAVVKCVLHNIRTYTPWRFGVGGLGVWRTTGPIAYTRAIAPLLSQHPYRLVRDETKIGLQYSIETGYVHGLHFRQRYTALGSPIIQGGRVRSITDVVYTTMRNIKHQLADGNRRYGV